MRRWTSGFGLLASATLAAPTIAAQAPGRAADLAGAWAALPPMPDARDVAAALAPYPGFARDHSGNWVLRRGSGSPRRVVACALEQPTFVVSELRADGYLRLHDPADPRRHPLWAQFHEGQRVRVATADGSVPGVVAVRSTHLLRRRAVDSTVTTIDDLWLDVGARSAAEATRIGVRMLAPVWRDWPTTRYGEGAAQYVAAPNLAARAGCAAVAEASRVAPSSGETVFVLAAQNAFGYAGISALLASLGAADTLWVVDPSFTSGDTTAAVRRGTRVVRLPRTAKVGATLGLALRTGNAGTLAESASDADLRALFAAVAAAAGTAPGEPLAPVASRAAADGVGPDSLTSAARLLAALADAYGPSGHERPVREAVLAALPDWARRAAVVDSAGNLVIEAGPQRDTTVIVAHLDELGFAVTRVDRDGTVALRPLGGFFNSLWEGQPALLHVDAPSGPVAALPGLFLPRAEATVKQPRELRAWFGLDSAALAARGVRVGMAVTGVKRATRLGPTRFTARAIDDRAGCAALVLALGALDPAKLTRRTVFAFSVREETGLEGAAVLAARYGPNVHRVYAVDTFVASDSPLESTRFADTPLGAGPVIRALDNSSWAPFTEVDRALRVARAAGVAPQVGTTNGGNDGAEFVRFGAVDLPLSWPGRYSHSPVETLDLRDLRALGRFVLALSLAQ